VAEANAAHRGLLALGAPEDQVSNEVLTSLMDDRSGADAAEYADDHPREDGPTKLRARRDLLDDQEDRDNHHEHKH